MPDQALSTRAVQKYYDRVVKGYDWMELFEAEAKRRAQELLELQPGHYLLNVGAGTGKDNRKFQAIVGQTGAAFGIDLSWGMARFSRDRSSSLFTQADARWLPYPAASFDRLYAAYLLDLMPLSDIPRMLAEFQRVLKPEGRMVVLSLTKGITPASRFIVGLWNVAYRISPVSCGGCRPLDLATMAVDSGFPVSIREVITQLGIASEIIVVQLPNASKVTLTDP